MKKIHFKLLAFLIIAVMIFTLGFPLTSAFGQNQDTIGKIVNCNYRVNVRSGPSTSYVKIGTAPKGATYTVLGKSGSWYKIDYKGRAGYIYGRYIKIISNEKVSSNNQGSGTNSGKIVNCNYRVNVRSGPGTSYKKIGTAPKGATYTITGKTGPWYQITYNGKTAYIYSRYIMIVSSIDQKSGTLVGKIVNCNYWVNVRSGPSTSYKKIGTAPKGATYTVFDKVGSWYKIKYKGRVGYIYGRYINVIQITPAPTPKPTPVPSVNETVIAGYYASWSAYTGYTPLSIPADKLTHIDYAFANIGSD